VFALWTSGSNRASNVPVDIVSSTGTTTVSIDQRVNGGQWVSLGVHDFAAGTSGSVLIGTAGTSGYVVADAVKFVLLEAPPGFEAWRMEKFDAAELADTAVSGFHADPDGDGRENLLEYALGFEPKIAESAFSPVLAVDGEGCLTLTYNRPKHVTGVTYLVEVTEDLAGSWASDPVTETVVFEDDLLQTIRAADSGIIGASSWRFMRLRVETGD
jgi:hypothetical protein